MRLMPLSAPYNLITRTYHTVGHFLAYAEGDQYGTNDRDLAETVIACGFADLDPNPPVTEPQRADPPPAPREPPHPAHKPPRH